jgi:hypothetical protein
LPARNVLTWSLCPLGQVKRIPISRPSDNLPRKVPRGKK